MNPPSNPARTPALRWLWLLVLLLALNGVQSACAQSYVLTNLWSIGYKTNTFLNNDGNLCRGLAYNPATGHLLVVSRAPVPDFGTNVFGTNGVYILDATTGAVVGKLAYDASLITGGNFAVSMIGVTDDGVIYVGNLTAATANGPFKLYRWANESAQPQLVYSGDPSGGFLYGASPQRYGDSLALRGTGAGTQILLGTFNQTVALLRTADGINFTATMIITGMAAADSRWGIAWGSGDTFWVKQGSMSGTTQIYGNLRQLRLDLVANTATIVTNIPLTAAPLSGPLDVDPSRNLAAVIDTTNHKLLVYDISGPSNPILQDTAKSFPAANANGNFVGSVAFRNGKLFALESNNGILAYMLGQTSLAATIVTAPAGIALWQGVTYTISAVYGGTRPFTYQWQFAGTNIPGATQASLTITNISFSQAGNYSVAVSNSLGGAVSANAALTVTPANASAQATKLWDLPAGTRPYLTYRPGVGDTVIGYKEYGVAINPVNTNIIVVTRLNPTNMIAVLDSRGNHLRYIDYSGLSVPVTGLPMNKVDVADDGTVYVCNFAGTAGTFIIYGFGDDSGTTSDKWVAFNGDPANGATGTTNAWGYSFSVRGSGLNTEILIGSSTSNLRNFAILKPDASYVFHSTLISVDSTVIAGFSRLGMDWGPLPNTVWAKTSSGNLYLVQYDLATGTGTAMYSYPQAVTLPNILRTIPSSFTEMKYDPLTGLLAGFRNGSPPSPVSVLFYDVSNLDGGPFVVDQEFYTAYNSDIEWVGSMDFANGYLVTLGENNGLMMFHIDTNFVSIPTILSQPAGATSYVGTPATLSVVADSTSGMNYQWYLNGQSIQDATSATYTIPSVQTNLAGTYTVRVSNSGGYRESAPATLTVLVPYQTAQMTNIWSLSPGSRGYLNTDYKEYGMAFNPATSNLLVISLEGGYPTVAVLDALTGVDKTNLDVSAITGSGRMLHKIGVADDGVVYACNQVGTAANASSPFKIYRWSDDSGDPSVVASVAFQGDPTPKNNPNSYAGLTFGVRGAGKNTQILLGTYTNVVSILTTTDGTNFVANEIKVAAAPAKFCRLGLCFGAGNTFWTKSYAGDPGGPQLDLVQYDLAAGTGTFLKSYTSGLPTGSSITSIAYDDTLNLLGGIGTDTGRDSVQVFDVSNLAAGPQLRDQELFPTGNPSIEQNGAITFGLAHTCLFALAENNGIMAFAINAKYSHFKILGVTPAAGSVTLTWEAVSSANYQVQRAASLGGGWADVGGVITAAGDTASYMDTNPDPNMRFYRVVAK
jgi:hypothetical protein